MAELKEARVPDIGGYDDVPVIEVLVKPGDVVAKDQGLVTLESDKATMEVPAPFAGTIREVKAKLGDSLSEGSLVALIEPAGEAAAPRAEPEAPAKEKAASETGAKVAPVEVPAQADRLAADSIAEVESGAPVPALAPVAEPGDPSSRPPLRFEADAVLPGKVPYASPAVRLFARELGVDLAQVTGTQRGGRIGKEDVQNFVKAALAGGVVGGAQAPTGSGGGGLNLIPWPKVDFAKFGEIESKPLSRIQKISGANLARNWAMIPHVTQHDDADITELEALRVALNNENAKAIAAGKAGKLTMLAFLIKASVAALQK
jgi:pyruvate dehydrogenase E2 component (dihydrolipoamide acetyltransferase)